MKRITASLLAILATVALVSLFVPSSFAAKAMSDDEMDATTAKGQSAINKGSGNQIVDDNSHYKLKLKDFAQDSLVAGNAMNVAGENNVAAAINAVNGSGQITQKNDIDQNKAATVSDVTKFEFTKNTYKSHDSSKNFSDETHKTWAFAESIAPATITLDPTITTTANGNGDATATGHGNAEATVNNTGTYDEGLSLNVAAAIDADIDVDLHRHRSKGAVYTDGEMDGDSSRSRGQRYEIQANVQHEQDNYLNDKRNTQVDATGNDAAIAQATANTDVQANGVGIGKTLTEVDIKLPIAKSGSGSFDELTTCDSERHSLETCDTTVKFSHAKTIVADDINYGGNQNLTDDSCYSVELRCYAQADARVVNLFNVAGRNNAAAAWNIAADVNDSQIAGAAGGGTVLQRNSIVQVN